MPPKLQVKPKAPPGGRRGGRGGATAAAAAAAATTGSAAAASTPASFEGTTTPAGESSAVSSAAAATTRSIAPPVGRLDSLKLTSGSASGTPAPSTPGGGGGGSGGGGMRGKAPLRFKPKAVVRKTAEERAKLEATVAATSSKSNPNTDPTGASSSTASRGGFSSRDPRGGGDHRGRGRGGRGRGRGRGGADAGGYQAVTSTASGPFALGSVTSGRSKVIHERGVEFRAAASKSKKTRGITIDDGGVWVKSERDDPDYYSETDEESDGGPKVNVERIEDLVDSGDEEGEGDGEVVVKSTRMPAMFPLRVERYRHEEKERAIPIFKDPETTGKKGKGILGGRKVKVEDGEEDLEVKVKAEAVDDGDMAIASALPIDIDASGAPQHPISTSRPPSPELSKKISLKPSQSPETKRKSRGKSAGVGRRRTQSHVLSPEEEMEVKMEEEDRLATLRELGMSAPRVMGGVEDESAAAGDLEGIKNGDLFFFQFPTVIPPLERIEPPAVGLGDGGPAVVDVDASVKPGQKKPGAGKKKVPLDPRAVEKQVLPQGVVGQLRVHRSGRVSILWGNPEPPQSLSLSSPSSHNQPILQPTPTPASALAGAAQPIEMTVTRGAQCEFLQDVVVMNPTPKRTQEGSGTGKTEGTPPAGKEGEEEGGVLGVVNRGVTDPKTGKMVGGVWSLGQVRGKFVVSPDFGKLLGSGGGR